MSAGESAYDVARRQREKAARLERSAAKWEQGAAGEVEVAKALAGLPSGWVVLHDLAWPGRPKANIDHVVIGPGGVFVIDAKNWTGSVEVRDQVLRQNGRAREQAVISVAEAAIALQQVLPVSQLVAGVLCFVRDDEMTGWARDVMVCTSVNLVAMLTSRTTVLDAVDVERCARAVRSRAPSRVAGTAAKPPRTAAAPRRGPTASRRKRSQVSWVKLVGALLFLAVVLGGGLTKVSDWASKQLVEDVTPVQSPKQRDGKPEKHDDPRKAKQSEKGAGRQG